MTDDDLSGFVFDPESGVMLPALTPTDAPSGEIVVLRREEPKPAQKFDDARIAMLNGWVVGDVLEGEDATGFERIRITAIGEERVLGRLVGVKGKTARDWEAVTVGQARERMFTLSNRIWRKA
jgi:hypothetical protein